jgi:hypothetical protein
MASKQRRVSISYRVTTRRSTFNERSNTGDSKLPSITQESNQAMVHNDDKPSTARREKVIKTDNYHKIIDAKKRLLPSENNSKTCTIL